MRLVPNFLRQPRLCQTLQYEKQVVIYYKNNIYFNIDQELTSFYLFWFKLEAWNYLDRCRTTSLLLVPVTQRLFGNWTGQALPLVYFSLSILQQVQFIPDHSPPLYSPLYYHFLFAGWNLVYFCLPWQPTNASRGNLRRLDWYFWRPHRCRVVRKA